MCDVCPVFLVDSYKAVLRKVVLVFLVVCTGCTVPSTEKEFIDGLDIRGLWWDVVL